jgi:serine/threonine-protein kinase
MSDNPPTKAELGLLAGVLALRGELITADDLRAALEAAPSQPPAEVLARQGRLASDLVGALERLAAVYLTACPANLAWLGLLESHADLRGWVQGLLTPLPPSSTDTDSLPSTQEASPPTRPPAEEDFPAPGRIGSRTAVDRYRRVVLHARGGLGVVYQARDEELGRMVALKEIQGEAADQPTSQARFLFEAEVTGNLEHPGIVPVYGLGCYPDGRPFYAMRFIHGRSLEEEIKRFHEADRSGRDPSERMLHLRGLLGRFVAACNALAYAHSRGVLHRDLKPANIMLGEYGETLVVDWGLAKLQPAGAHGPGASDWPVSAGDLSATMAGTVVGTPVYMPPEQATGEHDQVGPASDVYALGATLYQLLTGCPPFMGSSVEDILWKVARGDCVPARQVHPSVPAALSAICRKAMAPRPEQRYGSVRSLAEEVERWLADEPVAAYRESLVEQTRRWGRRHRTLVSSMMVLLVVGLVGLALGLWAVRGEQKRTEQERDHALEAEEQARANLDLARNAVDECFGLAKSDPVLQGENLRAVRRRLLEKTLPFYKEFRNQDSADPALASQQAEYLFRVAFITEEIGSKTEAIQFLKQALDIRVRLARENPDDRDKQADLAGTWHNLGALQSQAGDPQRGLASCQEARRIYQKLVQANPTVAQYRAALATTWSNLGQFQHRLGQRRQALESTEQALKIRDELTKAFPAEPAYQADLASTWVNLAVLQREAQKSPEALVSYGRARDIYLRLVKAHPNVGTYQAKLATLWNNLGVLQSDLGRPREALQSHQRAHQLRARLVQVYPEVTSYQADLGATWDNLGTLHAVTASQLKSALQNQGILAAVGNSLVAAATARHQEALQSFNQALAIRNKLAKDHPRMHEYQAELAGTWHNLGKVHSEAGEYDEALNSYLQARDMRAKLVASHGDISAYHVGLADTSNTLALLYMRMSNWSDALESIKQVIALLEPRRKREPDNPDVRQSLCNAHLLRAFALGESKQHREAVAAWDEVIRLESMPGRANAWRLKRAQALLQGGEEGRAVEAARELGKRSDWPDAMLYELASVVALSASAASRRLPARKDLADAWAREAVALLERARRAGAFKDPKAIAQMKMDSDLDFLRTREDFRAWLKRLDRP